MALTACLQYFFDFTVFLGGSIMFGHSAFPEIPEKTKMTQNIFFTNIMWPSVRKKKCLRDLFLLLKSSLHIQTNSFSFRLYLLCWIFRFLYIQLINFLNSVVFVNNCSHVHFAFCEIYQKSFLSKENSPQHIKEKLRTCKSLFCFPCCTVIRWQSFCSNVHRAQRSENWTN